MFLRLGSLGLLFLLLNSSWSVDRANFKTCDQSSFCARQRQIKTETIIHRLEPSSVKINSYGITAVIHAENQNQTLSLDITYNQHSIFHVLIDELANEYRRFRVPVQDVLQSVQSARVKCTFGESSLVLEGQSADKAVVHYNPFYIDFLLNDKVVATANKRNLLNFEHQRIKPIVKEQPVAQEDNHTLLSENHEVDISSANNSEDSSENIDIPKDSITVGENNVDEQQVHIDSKQVVPEDQSWSEYFKEHLDTRPHGLNSISMDFDFQGFDHVYGIPEHADGFILKSTSDGDPYRLYNLDVFEYEVNSKMALYGSVPVIWGHNQNNTVGVLWLNPSETWIDIDHSNSHTSGIFSSFFSKKPEGSSVKTRWISESGLIDLYVFMGHTPSEVMNSYASLVGTTRLPPLFAIAYHQCRWNYNDEADVLFVDKQFDEYEMPVDVLWLDIEHTDGKRYFTWDRTKFPNPKEMVDKLNLKGRKLVTVVDPHIKRDPNWPLFSNSQNSGIFVKTRDGTEYDGWCWPGSSAWPDFTDKSVRQWWSNLFLSYEPICKDSMFTWNDMGEPSVFNGPEVTMHKDAKHANDWEHRDIHNLYGLYVHKSTWDGLMSRSNGVERPFVLSRAFFVGSQRTAAVWTGDNTADWSHLKITTPMLLSLSIVGLTLCGADVGGFFGNPDPELLTRWYQAGAYQPFFRAHAHIDSKRREPWLVSLEYIDPIRKAIQARYHLLPYWYTLFARSEANGQPVMAPMWFHFPKDVNTFNLDEQYMIGEAVLVRPVTEQGVSYVQVYFPKGTWYHYPSFEVFTGDQLTQYPVTITSIPVFYRGGWIIPRKERIRRSSWLMRDDPYTFVVCLDPQESDAFGYLYIDDFHSTSKSSAQFFKIIYQRIVDPTGAGVHGGRLRLSRLPLPGETSVTLPKYVVSSPKIERIVVVGFSSPLERITVIDEHQPRRNLEFSVTPPSSLSIGFKNIPQIVVVRKPDLSISDDWEIHFVTGKESRDDL
ncbi:Neutral alpha-glucosidase AB isoform 2 [Schistosoma japonicum]|uniref:Glucosidase II subunit alpha n=2 Tax=Schistosoma japonicum TaxID=6182 RepID=A0A4Z2DLS5_SCHJA|nr:Neutral alpha-glucosidase AB isoform 2 [Schistosoma japonicum]TNN17348.1 Neutral alpha-glucosidase AB isoform 2 [Schistosoma japonicum]